MASATDLESLCGRFGDGVAAARYGGVPPRSAARLGPEIGARLLLAAVVRAAAGRKIQPLLCVAFVGFYVRVIVRVGPHCNEELGEVAATTKASSSSVAPPAIYPREVDSPLQSERLRKPPQEQGHPPKPCVPQPWKDWPPIKLGYLLCCVQCSAVEQQHVGAVQRVGQRCLQCGATQLEAGGPLWLGQMADADFICELEQIAVSLQQNPRKNSTALGQSESTSFAQAATTSPDMQIRAPRLLPRVLMRSSKRTISIGRSHQTRSLVEDLVTPTAHARDLEYLSSKERNTAEKVRRPPLGSAAILFPLLRKLFAEAQLSLHAPSATSRDAAPVLHIPSACGALGCKVPPIERLLAALTVAAIQVGLLRGSDALLPPTSSQLAPPRLDHGSVASYRGTETENGIRDRPIDCPPIAVPCHWSPVAVRLATQDVHHLLWDVLRSWARTCPTSGASASSSTAALDRFIDRSLSNNQSATLGDGAEHLHSAPTLRQRTLCRGTKSLSLDGCWAAPSELRRRKVRARGECDKSSSLQADGWESSVQEHGDSPKRSRRDLSCLALEAAQLEHTTRHECQFGPVGFGSEHGARGKCQWQPDACDFPFRQVESELECMLERADDDRAWCHIDGQWRRVLKAAPSLWGLARMNSALSKQPEVAAVPAGHRTLSRALKSAVDGATLLLDGEYTEDEPLVIRRPVSLRAAPGSSPVLRRLHDVGSVLIIDVRDGTKRTAPFSNSFEKGTRLSFSPAGAHASRLGPSYSDSARPSTTLRSRKERHMAFSTTGVIDDSTSRAHAGEPVIHQLAVWLIGLRIMSQSSDKGDAKTGRRAREQPYGVSGSNAGAEAESSENGYALMVLSAAACIYRCTISSTSSGGVHVSAAAFAVFFCTEIRETAAHGIFISGRSRVHLSHCRLRACGSAALEVRGRASATLHGCRVHGSKRAGLFAGGFADLLAQWCDCYDCGYAGVEGSEQAEIRLDRCIIHHGHRGGVLGLGSSRLLINDCRLTHNSMANLTLRGAATAHTSRTLLSDSKASGAYVLEAGFLELHDCIFARNRLLQIESAWCIELPEIGERSGRPTSAILVGGSDAHKSRYNR